MKRRWLFKYYKRNGDRLRAVFALDPTNPGKDAGWQVGRGELDSLTPGVLYDVQTEGRAGNLRLTTRGKGAPVFVDYLPDSERVEYVSVSRDAQRALRQHKARERVRKAGIEQFEGMRLMDIRASIAKSTWETRQAIGREITTYLTGRG